MSEVQLSQVALKNGQSSAVKNFAAMMIKDHGKANAELKALAKTKGVSLPDSSSISEPAGPGSTTGSTATSGSINSSGTTGSANTASGTTSSSGSTTGSNSTSGSTTGTGTGGSSGGTNMDLSEKLERLTAAKGKEFDQAYIQLMMQDHLKAVSLFQQGAQSSDPAVKAYAAKTLPVLKMHLQHVTSLSQQQQKP
jgi:putative membrane protein